MTGSSAIPFGGSESSDADAAGWRRLHADAVARLQSWKAPDDQQERLRLDFLQHLLAHPDAMSKAGPPAHLTGSVIVLDEEGDSALLTLHRRAREWFQFGGHFEPGDASVWHAAMAGGSGGVGHIRHLGASADRPARSPLFSPATSAAAASTSTSGSRPCQHGSAASAVSAESIDVRWWPVDALPEGTGDDLRPLVDAARRRLPR